MPSREGYATARELRERAAHHRWLARQILDEQAVRALHALANEEARQAADLEASGSEHAAAA